LLAVGVTIADCGVKMGLNGVDNGRLWFSDVFVPREDLLNRFGDVTSTAHFVFPLLSGAAAFTLQSPNTPTALFFYH
jgi:acyl-CoA oxidase